MSSTKTLKQAWQAHGVDDDMPPHDLFVAGWQAASDELDLMASTLESRERNIETILSESSRRQAEIERLTDALKHANDQAEHFEREWYLRGDAIEALSASPNGSCCDAYPAAEKKARDAPAA